MLSTISPASAKRMHRDFLRTKNDSMSFGEASYWALALHTKNGQLPQTFEDAMVMNAIEQQCTTPMETLHCMLDNGIDYYRNVTRQDFLANTGLTQKNADTIINHLSNNMHAIAKPSALQMFSDFIKTTAGVCSSGALKIDSSLAIHKLTQKNAILCNRVKYGY